MESPFALDEGRTNGAVGADPGAAVSRLRRVAGETAWVVIGQAFTMIGGLLTIKILARTLSKAEFGLVALGTTGVSFANLLVFGPLAQGLLRHWSTCRGDGRLSALYRLAHRWGLGAAGLTMAVGLALSFAAWLWVGTHWVGVVAISSLVAVGTGWVSLPQSLLVAARRQRDVAWLGGGAAVARALAAGGCVLLLGPRAEWALLGQAVAAAGVVWFAQRALRRLQSADLRPPSGAADAGAGADLARSLRDYSWPFAVWGVFGWAQVGGDRWILQGFEGTAAVAGYAVISQLASFPLVFLTGILGMLGAPIAFSRRASSAGPEGRRRARHAVWLFVGVYALGALGILAIYWLVHGWLVPLVSDSRYTVMSSLLPPLTLGWALYYLGQMFAQFGLLEGRSAEYIAPKIGSAVVLVVMGLVVCPRFGAAGLVWSVGVAGAVYAGWCVVLAWVVGRSSAVVGSVTPC
jgi:O-antigen/teichoic acid export membrane protein